MTDYYFENALLADGWAENVRVCVDSTGTISRVEQGEQQDVSGNGAEIVSGVVLPGIPNLHSHAFQRAVAGLTEHRHSADGDSFWTWREVMHSFVTRLTPDDVLAIASRLYVEMLKAGFTSVGEFHYVHLTPDGHHYDDFLEMSEAILTAAGQTGIGVTLLPVLYSCGGYDGREANDGQRRFILPVPEFLQLIDGLIGRHKDNPQVRVGIAPHSVRQVPATELRECLDGFSRLDATAPIHIHVAEQINDVTDHVKATGARPVEWLLDNTQIDQRWCMVHATHMTDAETLNLAASGAVAGICPTTEANLGDGLFPLETYLNAGGVFGIGSDCHISVSPVEEIRWLEYGQRLIHKSRNVAAPGRGGSTGMRLLSDCLSGGAQALGRPVGAIAVGNRADWIVLDPDHPQLVGRSRERFIDSYIFAGNANPVQHVMVGGSWVVRDQVHHAEDAISKAYAKTAKGLLK